MALILEGAATAAECAEMTEGLLTPAMDRIARQGARLAAAGFGAPIGYSGALHVLTAAKTVTCEEWAVAVLVFEGALRIGTRELGAGDLAVWRAPETAAAVGRARILRVDVRVLR